MGGTLAWVARFAHLHARCVLHPSFQPNFDLGLSSDCGPFRVPRLSSVKFEYGHLNDLVYALLDSMCLLLPSSWVAYEMYSLSLGI